MKKNAFIFVLLCVLCSALSADKLPKGFVYLRDIVPDAVVDLRYCGSNNFLGTKVDGYLAERVIITRRAALALKKVQSDLKKYSMSVKVFDAYRPQRAVNHFVRWAKDLRDKKMKKIFYPREDKRYLFKRGYIASKSGHSRGSTIDLTIVRIIKGKDGKRELKELDMGTPFDFFGKESATEFKGATYSQKINRMLLRTLMEKHGFKHYSKEWWHFRLKNEPYRKTYFDFVVK